MVMSRSMTNMSSLSSMDYRSSTQSSTTVLRRGQPFFMAVRMKDRNFDPRRDILRASFSFGIGGHLNCANLSAYFFQFCLAGSQDSQNLFCPSLPVVLGGALLAPAHFYVPLPIIFET